MIMCELSSLQHFTTLQHFHYNHLFGEYEIVATSQKQGKLLRQLLHDTDNNHNSHP